MRRDLPTYRLHPTPEPPSGSNEQLRRLEKMDESASSRGVQRMFDDTMHMFDKTIRSLIRQRYLAGIAVSPIHKETPFLDGSLGYTSSMDVLRFHSVLRFLTSLIHRRRRQITHARHRMGFRAALSTANGHCSWPFFIKSYRGVAWMW